MAFAIVIVMRSDKLSLYNVAYKSNPSHLEMCQTSLFHLS